MISSFVATVCILGAATERAGAVASITLFDGTNTITVTDGGVNDASSMLGVVVFNGTIGIWDINVSTGLSKPILGSANQPEMDLNSINHSTGAGTLRITFTDTGFTLPGGTVTAAIGGTQNGGLATIQYQTFQNANLLTSIGTVSGTPYASSAYGFLNGQFEGSYSLSQVVTITHTATGTTSFDASLSVPDGGASAAIDRKSTRLNSSHG